MLRVNPQATLERDREPARSRPGLRDISPEGFLAVKGLCAGGGVLLGLDVRRRPSGCRRRCCMLAIFGGVGLHGRAGFLVSSRVAARRDAIRAALPDALDLLAVSVEAGLGFDGAIAKLTEHMEGPLDRRVRARCSARCGSARARRRR